LRLRKFNPQEQAAAGNGRRAGETMSTRLQTVGQLPVQQKISLMLVIAIAVALGAGGWMWSSTPDYRVLHANLGERDGGAVIAALQQMNVPYKFVDGTLMVPSNHVHEARMRLAGQGLPKGGLAGFELMENQKLGSSQFLEQVNYQRALEGELARSIQSVGAVQGARVHLALSKPSPFLREQPKTSASVLVNLHPGRTLEPMQVAAITHLVSNSMPGLPVKNITVVDQNGTLLSGETESGNKPALDPGQLKYRHDLEQNYAQRIEAILLPVVGPGNARAQVAAEIDFTETEQADEIYKPNQKPEDAAVRSQQTSESGNQAPQAGGVPGALTNQAPAPATAPVNAPAAAPGAAASAAAAPASTRRDSTVNYEVDKTIRHTRQAMGRIKKLSVAVVVNHNQVKDAKGAVTARPLTEAQKKQIAELVRGVVGFNEERGDSISVVNSAFKKPDVEEVAELPVWKQPQTVELVKDTGKHLLIGALALYLLLGIVRPMLRNLTQAPPLVAQELLPEAAGGVQAAATVASGYDQTLQSAKQIAKQDPKVVANVVKAWVGNE